MGLGRREEEVPLAGVLCEDPPASESAAVRSPYMGETRAAVAAARPCGRISPSRGTVPNPKRAALKLWV